MSSKRKLRYGMIGGGEGAFIGAVHRMAMNLDGQIELVAGCFSSDPEKSRRSGEALYVKAPRVYSDYGEMAERESARPDHERLDFVTIVTPNHLHAAMATLFLESGFHVVCEKPMTFTLNEAWALREIVRKTGRILAVTHNYTGYPMVKEAREFVRRGEVGRVLKMVIEYPQGWLLEALGAQGGTLAGWRTDPARAGATCCLGDIGIHAENLGRYITGLEIDSICAEFNALVPGHQLEDDANLLIQYKGGAVGVLHASQVSCGEENNLNIRIYGEKAGLAWHQEHPNELRFQPLGEPARIVRRGNGYVSDVAKHFTRLPFGHPEAYIEAFANVYLEIAAAIRDRIEGKPDGVHDFPTVEDGVYGMAFLETAVQSARSDIKWTRFVE